MKSVVNAHLRISARTNTRVNSEVNTRLLLTKRKQRKRAFTRLDIRYSILTALTYYSDAKIKANLRNFCSRR